MPMQYIVIFTAIQMTFVFSDERLGYFSYFCESNHQNGNPCRDTFFEKNKSGIPTCMQVLTIAERNEGL